MNRKIIVNNESLSIISQSIKLVLTPAISKNPICRRSKNPTCYILFTFKVIIARNFTGNLAL